MPKTIEELETELGPHRNFVLGIGDVPILREWAVAKGFNPFDVAKMNSVELVNLYHSGGEKSSEPQPSTPDIHDVIVKVLEACNAPGFEVSLTRRVARAEMQQEILSGETTKRLIQETLESLAPRRIEIANNNVVTQLDGLQHYATEKVIRVVAMNHPTMLVGPAGCGKTTIGQQVARALNLPFFITSTINDTHELTGFVDGYGKYHTTPFRQAYEFGGVWVADEIDAWDASALLAANAALANGIANFPDSERPIPRHNSFRIVATANTFGSGADRVYVGRNELDAASLDRFATIDVDYDLNLERSFASNQTKWLEYVWSVRKKVTEKKIRHVVSSRAIGMGASALINGIDWNDTKEIYLFKGMSKTDRAKVE